MKSTIDRGWGSPAALAVRRFFPLLALLLVLAALAIPMLFALAPGILGPRTAPSPEKPAWQQAPTELSTTEGVGPLDTSAPLPVPSEVARLLNGTLMADGGGSFTGVVQDALTGTVLFDRGGDENRIPASNMKLLTAVSALKALGTETVFSTKVVQGATPATVVLTGGGDVLLGAGASNPDAVLGHAGLATLAMDTVASLKAKGVTGELTVMLDDSLFSGPALNPNWSPEDVAAGETAPLFPLALGSARFDPAVTTGPRPQDAALDAAQLFAEQLRAAGAGAGLTVASAVERGTSSGDGSGQAPQVLASAESATVRQQVDLMLQVSDNYLAEILGRMTAVKTGLTGSNDGATAAVQAQLAELGVDAANMRLADVSGLALENRVTARQFSEVVRAITSGADTRLRAALAGFPVAGLTGTLGDRYADATTAGGAGLVRAKTGTLNSVIALSGYVVDADGRLLVFSFIGNGLTPGAAGNKAALDRSASILASCGCR